MKLFVPFFVFLFSIGSLMAQKPLDELLENNNTRSISYISVEELRMFQTNDSVTILDAREPEEFIVSHLEFATNVGYNEFDIKAKQLQKFNKNIPVVVYCSLGIRSEKIAEKLKKAGFKDVKNLYGGIFEWKNKGFPVIDSKGKETENVHAFSKHWSQYLHAGNPIF